MDYETGKSLEIIRQQNDYIIARINELIGLMTEERETEEREEEIEEEEITRKERKSRQDLGENILPPTAPKRNKEKEYVIKDIKMP